MRELREFRAAHDAYREQGIVVAGCSRDDPRTNRRWVERLKLPYPLLTDAGGEAGRALGITRRIGVGAWTLELFRRATLFVDLHGVVGAVWGEVKIRGHAMEVLQVARAAARWGT